MSQSANTSPPSATGGAEFDDELSDAERETLEWLAEHSSRLGEVAERILQEEEESGEVTRS